LVDKGIAQTVRPVPLQRMRSVEHSGYPLKRTLLVTFNRDRGRVLAELKEVSRTLGIQGVGYDEESALQDLERQFDQLVREKVRIPPHARNERNEPILNIVNYLVDWKKFDRENPTPHLLWGRIVRRGASGRPTIHWLVGPDDLREKTAILPWRF